MSDKSAARHSALSLPAGGGAIKSIGETFQTSLFSGTAGHRVPIVLSPGRNGFAPELSLEYSSGHGNDIFGLGWQLTLPRITRKTEKGLPRYTDEDVFVMSGAEDLVRRLKEVLDPDSGESTWVPEDPIEHADFAIFRYRPRTEGMFARIERWVQVVTGDTHWRCTTKDNVTSVFGATPASRLADPENEQHVYEWLLHETFDAFGNHSVCEYAADDPGLYAAGGRLPDIFEQRRRASRRYLRRICYGNLPDPLTDAQQRPISYPDGAPVGRLVGGRRYAFELVLDYGDWELPTVLPHPGPTPEGGPELFGGAVEASPGSRPVPLRPDRFSDFRAGFDIRTLRRCRRVLMFHHFAELGGPTLVRSTDFTYLVDPDTQLSLLSSATVTGYDRAQDADYQWASVPPVEFRYSRFEPQTQRYQSLTTVGGEPPPLALSDANMAVVDLFGDGLPDILHTGPAGFRYWRNLGGGVLDRPRTLAQLPADISLDQPGIGLGDVTGNGIVDLLVNSGPLPGFFETTVDGAWQRFTPYESHPSFTPQDPGVRLLDLTGDGRADALRTQDRDFLWFACQGAEGFAPARSVARIHDLDEFPDVFFDDPTGRVRLADMTGDGLHDIVLVQSGGVDYWPNLGYGRFGRRVAMANAPALPGAPADFDPKRLFLADLNGTGCADLVYVDARRVHFWFNQSGNAWSAPQVIVGTPHTTDASAVEFADVFGSGTATLLWSHDSGASAEPTLKALDFCGGSKPYVLTSVDNNLGATTTVSYVSSTAYFLQDQARGHPWFGPLPFPVQVVAKVAIVDHISGTKRVSTFSYHHGHYDGREREFCGFGRVDRFDTESFEDFAQGGSAEANPEQYHVPAVQTRSWFHTGSYFDSQDQTEKYRTEYYGRDAQAVPLGAHDVVKDETPAAAHRALRGALLRTEVYADDGSDKAVHPYQVDERRYHVGQLQPRGSNHHAVYFSHVLEVLSCRYERNVSDPRIGHELTLEMDDFGNVRRSINIAYGRRQPDESLSPADRETQTRTFITYTENRYTNAVDQVAYRAPVLCEARTYELTGFSPVAPGAPRFSHAEWVDDGFARLADAPSIGYEARPDPAVAQKRLIEHVQTFYRRDDLGDLLPLGALEPLALPGESRRLAFTAGMLTQVYGDRVDDTMLEHCRYVRGADPGTWWVPSERVFYSPGSADPPAAELAFARQHFFTACRARDAFGNTTMSGHDPYDLLVDENIDALGNRISTDQDYRILQPFRLTDANGNRREVAFDVLGMVVGSAVMGKEGETHGDALADFTVNLSAQQLEEFMADPVGQARTVLGTASTGIVYDLERYRRKGQPACAVVLARETHGSDPAAGGGPQVQVSLSYSDGFGREVQSKAFAGPGPLTENGPVAGRRWTVSGWTVFNNKGNPVKQFEPFFDDTHEFRFDRRVGVGSTSFYDPVERVVATLHANHTWEKLVPDPWREASWDVNDTTLIADPRTDADVGAFFQRLDQTEFLPTWHGQRQGGDLGGAERAAAEQAAGHAATPAVSYTDALGRQFLHLTHNRIERDGTVLEEVHTSRTVFDIEGNEREIVDASGRVAMRYEFDMLAGRIHQASMEAGERWMLNDVGGQPAFAWNSRGHRLRTTFDALRRPVDVLLQDGDNAEQLVGHTVFGESVPEPEAANLRGQVVQQFDQAGVATSEAYDFKGNLLVERRQLAQQYRTTLDWSAAPTLDEQVYVTRTSYDALDRPVRIAAPDGSVTRPSFNAIGQLDGVQVQPRDSAASTTFVAHVDYDAKGQRTGIVYGNGLQTRYAYDRLTFRLRHAATLRGGERLQDLSYVYDPVGNITQIEDLAQQTLYFDNVAVVPRADYAYDALYRLINAQGREHIGQATRPETSWNDAARTHLPHPHDGRAMRRYTEEYEYDPVGNMRRLAHRAEGGSWTRSFDYREPGLIEPGTPNNRLSSAVVGGSAPEIYPYDAHGNMTATPHLAALHWDFRDQLRRVDLGGGGTAYYVYDAGGRRLRTVIEKNSGALVEERRTLGGFEVHRRSNSSGVVLERETLHVTDDGARVALIDTRIQGHEPALPARSIRYQLDDHLGSATLEVDDAGQIITYEEYYPYGSTSYQASRSLAEVSVKRYRYTGMERDAETGLNYHGTRYYAPWLCRWINGDPIGTAGGVNLYRYAGCDPVGKRDTNGLEPTEPKPEKPEAKAETTYREKLREKYGKAGPTKDITPDKHVYASGVDAHLVVGEGKAAVNVIGDNKHSNVATRSGGSRSFGGEVSSFDNAAKEGGRQLVRNIRDARRVGDLDPATAFHAIEGAKDGMVLKDIGISGYNTQVARSRLAEHQASVTQFDQFAEATAHRGSVNVRKALGPPPKKSTGTRRGKGKGGLIGKLVAVGIGLYVLVDTGSVAEAAQTANPMAGTTDAALANDPTTMSILRGTASDLYNLTPIATIEYVMFDLLGPKGGFMAPPDIVDRAKREGRNPFCAVCHGTGGALDPNNKWNKQRELEMRFGDWPVK